MWSVYEAMCSGLWHSLFSDRSPPDHWYLRCRFGYFSPVHSHTRCCYIYFQSSEAAPSVLLLLLFPEPGAAPHQILSPVCEVLLSFLGWPGPLPLAVPAGSFFPPDVLPAGITFCGSVFQTSASETENSDDTDNFLLSDSESGTRWSCTDSAFPEKKPPSLLEETSCGQGQMHRQIRYA